MWKGKNISISPYLEDPRFHSIRLIENEEDNDDECFWSRVVPSLNMILDGYVIRCEHLSPPPTDWYDVSWGRISAGWVLPQNFKWIQSEEWIQ